MKKFLAIILVALCVVALVACDKTPATKTAEPTVDVNAKSEGVMTYAEYAAAEKDAQVVVETYVQAKQSWWDNKITLYTQDKDGGYFVYNAACTEADAAKLVPGTKVKVTGYKSEWSGEVEIIDGTLEIIEGVTYIAEPLDVTALVGTDDLLAKQNLFVSMKGLTVEASKDKDGNDVAYLYKWDGSGSDGDDLYFNVSLNGKTYQFTVESYLCDASTAVYSAVKNLKIGDKIDLEGFLYWYNAAQPHVTAVSAAK